VNDCARGSLCGALTSTLISVAFLAGLGGFLTETLLVSCVRTVPEPLYVPSASDANTVEPGRTTVLGGTAVTLTVLVPLLTLVAGFGLLFGSLKKKLATISPQLSEINSALVIFATAPEVVPTILNPFSIYPKYFCCVERTLVPKFISLEVGE
jgi:hypothetical protein